MLGRFLLVLFIVIAGLTSATDTRSMAATSEEKRVALVIGNSAYQQQEDRLKNPANDAKAVALELRALGIEVIEAIDLDYQGMRQSLRAFDRALQDANAGLFYYAGHGMEYRGRNYLFPTDAILETEGDVGLGLIHVNQVLQVMEASVPTRLIFLDACRNNPLARRFSSSLGTSRSTFVSRGLGRIDAAVGTFIAYATAPGALAADGKGENSPFTTAMLQHLKEPGLEISQLMHKVRNSVIEATDERQIPWESSSLRGPFILNLDVTINPVLPSDGTTNDGQGAEMLFWESVKDSDHIASLDAYLERFGDDGIFAPLARARIESLEEDHARKLESSLRFDRTRVQSALAALGYEVGITDGVFGPQTRRAIERWQGDQGDEVTSFLSAEQVAEVLAKAKEILPATKQTSSSALPKDDASKTDDAMVKAATLYRKSCDKGDANGCANLGYHYENGWGLKQDIAKAKGLYETTCHDDGYAWSCGRLGDLYKDGKGVDEDYNKAIQLYRMGCDLGHGRGCGNLAWYYQAGKGVDQSYGKAKALYERACGSDDNWSCSQLGALYEDGLGVERDREKAREFYQKACSGDNERGCARLGALQQGLKYDER